jgi:hypothetical protein
MEKYSLFLTETRVETEYTAIGHGLIKQAFIYIDTFDTLEEAKKEQKEYDLKSIILPSY